MLVSLPHCLAVAGALALAPGLAPAAQAQAAAPPYAGPRYPGGPDSLRAMVSRQLRPASPAWVGAVFVRLELDAAGNAAKADFLVPPVGTPAATLARNRDVQALATQVVQRQPRWQPGPAVTLPPGRPALSTPTLLLPFGLAPEAVPLAYSDGYPTFAVPGGQLANPLAGVATYLNRQLRYPAADLRARREGTVYAYLEVSETGAIEHRQIVGSVSPTLDAEVLRVVQLLPPALSPPRQAGRPVRVYYVLPFSFKAL